MARADVWSIEEGMVTFIEKPITAALPAGETDKNAGTIVAARSTPHSTPPPGHFL